MSASQSPPLSETGSYSLWTWAALLVSLAGVAGSLYLSLGMHLKACPLCFYQRVFIMGAAAVLLTGLLAGPSRGGRISLLAFPLAIGGLTVAGFHTYLEATSVLECPHGVLQLGSAPQQSLALHLLLTVLLALDVVRDGKLIAPALGSLLLGALFALGAIQSVPSTVIPDYSRPVDEDGCRKLKS